MEGDITTQNRLHSVGRHNDAYYGPITDSVVGGHGHTINMTSDSRAASVFDLLEPHITKAALYNSRMREKEHASTCHPDTHARIIRNIESWETGTGSSVCWLYGPAGTGKSTIAHTIAESQEDTRLAGTFFFSRNKGAREDITKLIPTLAYQIAERIPSVRMQMHNVLYDRRTLLEESLKRQFRKLIAEPLMNIGTTDRVLIVIDGLDECAARDGVLDLIRLLGETMATQKYPLRFLLTSRPEPEIRAAFQQYKAHSTFLWLALEDSREDVRKYLRTKLMQLRREYGSDMAGERMEWPSNADLGDLVEKSEGLFIYASTVVQYLNDRREPPQEKLRKVLRMHEGVDPLYTQVMTEAQQCKDFDRVIGSLMYLQYPLAINKLSLLLRLDSSNIRIAVGRCHSILAIPDDDDEPIQPYHASLRDFLTNQERSRDFFCAPARFHAHIAVASLQAITRSLRVNDTPIEYACITWYHHCSSLLCEANTSQDFQLLCTGLKAEMKEVNLEWLKYWMVEAFVGAGVSYIRVNLPSPKGMQKKAKDVHTQLFRIGKVLDDFLSHRQNCHGPYGRGPGRYGFPGRLYGGFPPPPCKNDVNCNVTEFFESQQYLRSNFRWKIQNIIDKIIN